MYYPYHESKAGSFRDKHRTSDASEYLLADKDVVLLAKDLLTDQVYQEAEEIAVELTESGVTQHLKVKL
jgi:hypothetical protein